ncbi:MAG: eukaryotic-like serine/threonine-protein kinase [Thermoleophilaceae bacterium]|nr:eukaryotic-like serine/threonine-protein kinase [Thermoleophilaceae bacterium]
MTPMYEPTPTTYSASPDETLIAEAIEGLPDSGDRHHTIVNLEHQSVCLSVARAPAQEDCWVWFSAAAAERAELSSDRLLPLVSAGNFDGWFYVAHDIGQAVPLSEYRRIAELSTARALALLLGIAHALDDAVSQGKPPCEVTPDSVFLDPRLGAMVGDLGVAREALGNPAAGDDARAAWVAPEVLRGEDAHPRSAVYSFGAIAYTLLTGGPPHTGTPQDIANARPPRLSDVRPDLPATLDTVFAVAMAPDPRKRYATAAEARHLLNLVIYGAPSVPALEAPPRFPRRGSSATKSSPARHAPRLQAPVEADPRPGRALVALLVGGALAAGAVAGTVVAGSDNPPAPHPEATAAGMSVELPDGWRQRPAEAGLLEAYPARDPKSGLKVAIGQKRLQSSDEATPVLLGDYESWHHEPVAVNGTGRVARYVVPTRSGKVEINCTAAPGAAANTLALCERTASTLQLPDSQKAMSLAAVGRAQDRWRAAANALKIDRAEGRRVLARARENSAQIAAASGLAGSYEHAARRFAALANGEPVVKAARDTAATYRGLARAAGSNSASAWSAALADVRAAEAKLSRAVAG